jgi:hypothetical protein
MVIPLVNFARLFAVCLLHDEVVEDAHHWPLSEDPLPPSRIDMLAGLSMLYIFRTPPGFCADAVPPADIAISSTLPPRVE